MNRSGATEAVALLLAHYPLQSDRVPDASVLLMVKEFQEGCADRDAAVAAVKTCTEWFENVPSVVSLRRAVRYVPSLAPTVSAERQLTQDEQRKSEEAARQVFAAWRERRARERQREAVDGDSGPAEGGSEPAEGPEYGPGGDGLQPDANPGEGSTGP